jgi:hypothetical protein
MVTLVELVTALWAALTGRPCWSCWQLAKRLA